MLQRFLFWLFPDIFGAWRSFCLEVFRRLEALENKLQPVRLRMPVYVTLRGRMRVDGKEVAHGWTTRIMVEEGATAKIPFTPYHQFHCERVDILGPAIIEGVSVGNMNQFHSSFANPATAEFSEVCDVGNIVTVYLKGTP